MGFKVENAKVGREIGLLRANVNVSYIWSAKHPFGTNTKKIALLEKVLNLQEKVQYAARYDTVEAQYEGTESIEAVEPWVYLNIKEGIKQTERILKERGIE